PSRHARAYRPRPRGRRQTNRIPRARSTMPMTPGNPRNREMSWWIDRTGAVRTHCSPTDPARDAIAAGKVYLESRSGVITHLNNQPANIAIVSQQLLDVLHARFPGTRWWIK